MKRYKPLFLFIPALYLLLPILSFAQMTWTCACSSAQWSARSGHTSVVFDNKMWVIGGGMVPYAEDDVWYSSDGVYWTQTTDSAGWSVRGSHTSVVFDNKIWVIGGGKLFTEYNDVWYSTDGINWIQATASANWYGRHSHSSVVFDNRMWLIGGVVGFDVEDDVWYSTDGINWIQATDSAGWERRFGHSSVVFDDKMWVIGGLRATFTEIRPFYNDVWFSTDGINWIQATDSAGWERRSGHSSVVFDNKIWVIGGGYYYSDVWYSTDGVNWIQATDSAGWNRRNMHSSVVFDNKMWVIGGIVDYYNYLNDVWYSTGLGIEELSTHYAQTITPKTTIVRSVINLQSTINHSKSEIFLFDITGRKVADLKAGTNNIRHLTPGVYFIWRNINNRVLKIIVTK